MPLIDLGKVILLIGGSCFYWGCYDACGNVPFLADCPAISPSNGEGPGIHPSGGDDLVEPVLTVILNLIFEFSPLIYAYC